MTANHSKALKLLISLAHLYQVNNHTLCGCKDISHLKPTCAVRWSQI